MPTAVRREVKAIFGERTGSLPLNFATLAPLASRCAGVLGGKHRHSGKTLAMELPSMAPQSRVPSPLSTYKLIAASRDHIPVLRLGSVIGVMRLRRARHVEETNPNITDQILRRKFNQLILNFENEGIKTQELQWQVLFPKAVLYGTPAR